MRERERERESDKIFHLHLLFFVVMYIVKFEKSNLTPKTKYLTLNKCIEIIMLQKKFSLYSIILLLGYRTRCESNNKSLLSLKSIIIYYNKLMIIII